MQAIRITAYQNMGSSRFPSDLQRKESYPLPSYSSVIGMVYAACRFKEYVPMRISIQGTSDGAASSVYLHLVIHIIPDDRKLIDTIYEGLKRPFRYPSPGRWEPLLRIDNVERTSLSFIELEDSMELPCDAYIPVCEDSEAIRAASCRLHKRYAIGADRKTRHWTETVEAKFARAGTSLEKETTVLVDNLPVIDNDCPYWGGNLIPVFPA